MLISGSDIQIVVREGPDILETRRCRTMVMPDGHAGAVWRGLVYPVREGNYIDIGGEAFPPTAALGGTAALPDGGGFASIQGADEAYVVLAGPVAAREEASASLRAAGITVLRAGRYLGDPVDGFAADWFVRFEKPASDEPLDDLLTRVLGLRREQIETEPETASEARLRLLRDELARARGREIALRSELAETRAAARPAIGTDIADALLSELAEEQRLRHEAASGKDLRGN